MTAPSRRRPLFRVTEAPTGADHLVTEAAFADGMADRGSYRAICGARFAAAPMITAPGRTCPACRTVASAPRPPCRREPRGPAWWRRRAVT